MVVVQRHMMLARRVAGSTSGAPLRIRLDAASARQLSSLAQVPARGGDAFPPARSSKLAPLPPLPAAPSTASSTALALKTSKTAAKSPSVYAYGSTRPLRGRPLLPRSYRRRISKQQRASARREIKEDSIASKLGVSSARLSPFVRIDRQFKTFKPLTPSLRWVRFTLNPHLEKGGPERALTVAKRGTGGRNHHGRITVRGRGGGVKRRIRLVDFARWEKGEQEVVGIEYDPGRSAHIALIQHRQTGRRSYILAPDGLRKGDVVRSYRSEAIARSTSSAKSSSSLDLGIFRTQAIRPGNVLPLHLIPIGTQIHAISLLPTGPAKLVRAAGASGQLVALTHRKKSPPTAEAQEAQQAANEEQDELSSSTSLLGPPTHAQVKLQSGEVRLVPAMCCATIGRVSNIDHEHVRIGKAGRSRWLGRRPKVRGVAMNATDHPHGGGRGKSKSNMHPKSIYGWLAKGKRTRKPGTKGGNTMVIRERPRRNGKRLGKP